MARQVGSDANEESLTWRGGVHVSKVTTVGQGKGNVDKGREAWQGGRVRSNVNKASPMQWSKERVTNEASSLFQGK